MVGDIIWIFSIWLCAAIFSGIGFYAGKQKLPMWFWSGSTVDPNTISDIPAYNKEMKKMWIIFSIPYWITGISFIWFPIVSGVILGIVSTVGIGWLIWYYHRIEKRYKI